MAPRPGFEPGSRALCGRPRQARILGRAILPRLLAEVSEVLRGGFI